MSIAQSETSNSTNEKTVQLVRLLTELGPDIPEISRKLGQFKESVRYRYKEKILNKGFAVQGAVDHERLGLKRIMLVLDFAEEYRRYGQAILASMNELCYLVSFAKTMPEGYYLADFSAPVGLADELIRFFETLNEKGMFSKLEILEFDWIRVSAMKPEFYDFDTGRWDFNWSSPGSQDFGAARYAPSGTAKFDYVDLQIIKEIQMDANKSLKEISDKLNVNYKKLAWHYTTHVLGRRLLRGYSVNWMGTRYDYEIERVLHRQHRYFGVELFVRDPTEYELIGLRQALDRLPFLWAEAVGKNYAAELTFPVDCVVDGFQYLTETIQGVKEKASLYTIDQTDAISFTIPYSLFDQSSKKWTFNFGDLVGRYDQLILQIKKGTD